MNRSTWAGALVGTLLCLTAVAPVSAQLTGVTDRSSITGTTVDWSVVGGVDTPVPGGTVVTVGSRNLMLDLLNGVRSDQFGPCLGWLGNFAPCSKLVYAYDLGETPVSFSFSDYVGG